jgi:hypothetical protein
MRIRPGIIIAIVVVFAVLLGGRKLGWFGGKPSDAAGNLPAPEATSEAPSLGVPAPTPAHPARLTPPANPRPATQPVATATSAQVTPTPPQGLITNWEERIDDLLTTDGAEDKKAVQMLAMLPNLPEDGQVEAAQHISNLLPDEQYATLSPILTNAQTTEAVLDVLMTDVLNRPNGVKLNTLLDVARIPNHPKAEEAFDVLEVFLEDVDWDAVKASGNWAPAITAKDKWLKENPDE